MTTDSKESPSLTTQGNGMPENSAPPQTIIPPCEAPCGDYSKPMNYGGAPTIPVEPNCSAHYDEIDGGAEGIIRTNIDGTIHDVALMAIAAAEQRRQTVQAEAMVNLAVGATLLTLGELADFHGGRRGYTLRLTPEDLAEFQKGFTVDQKVDDGGFIITVKPKEV